MVQLRIKTNGKLVNMKSIATWMFFVLLTLPHMNPAYLNQFPLWETLLNFWRLGSFVMVVFLALFIKRKLSPIMILIGVWEIYLFITTWVNQGDIYSAATSAFSVLSIALLYEVALDKGETFLPSQLFCFEVVIYINLISEILYPRILFPDGIYIAQSYPFRPNWFLGFYNGYTKYFIPALMFAWLYKRESGNKFRAHLLATGIVISAIAVYAGGLTGALFCIIVTYVFFKDYTHVFNYFTYWFLHIIFFIAMHILRIQNLFQWLIDDILGKWESLELREFLWDKTLQFIADSPILGHGIQSHATRIAEYHLYYGIHSHNMLLEILYQGGAIGFVLWVVIVIVGGNRIFKYRHTAESKIIATAFLGWCVATLVEPFTTSFFVGMFVVAYHSNKVEKVSGRLPM